MRERLLAETECDLNIALEQQKGPLEEYTRLVVALRLMDNRILPSKVLSESFEIPIPTTQFVGNVPKIVRS